MTVRWTSACCAQALQVRACPCLVLPLHGGCLHHGKLQGLQMEPMLLSCNPDWHGAAGLPCHGEAGGPSALCAASMTMLSACCEQPSCRERPSSLLAQECIAARKQQAVVLAASDIDSLALSCLCLASRWGTAPHTQQAAVLAACSTEIVTPIPPVWLPAEQGSVAHGQRAAVLAACGWSLVEVRAPSAKQRRLRCGGGAGEVESAAGESQKGREPVGLANAALVCSECGARAGLWAFAPKGSAFARAGALQSSATTLCIAAVRAGALHSVGTVLVLLLVWGCSLPASSLET